MRLLQPGDSYKITQLIIIGMTKVLLPKSGSLEL